MNRRSFIRGLSGLAGLAVTAGSTLGAIERLTETDRQRLVRQMEKGGVIEGQSFYLDGPVYFEGLPDLEVRNCRFIVKSPDAVIHLGNNPGFVQFHHNYIEGAGLSYPWHSDAPSAGLYFDNLPKATIEGWKPNFWES